MVSRAQAATKNSSWTLQQFHCKGTTHREALDRGNQPIFSRVNVFVHVERGSCSSDPYSSAAHHVRNVLPRPLAARRPTFNRLSLETCCSHHD